MTHSPTCTGCPQCSAEMRSLLSMSTTDYSAWLTKQGVKHAASYAPPDPYRAGLQAMREGSRTFEDRWKAARAAALREGRA